MNRATVGAAVLGLGLLGSASAWPCGGGGVASQAGVVTNSQRVFISVRAAGTTDIVAQIAVPQTSADYGVLIPVPSEPTLDSSPVSSADMDSLDQSTRPSINHYSTGSSDSGCGCLGAGANDDDSSATGSGNGVVVSDPVEIGPVIAVSLTGDNADAVRGWLTDNGFALPDDDAATLGGYVGDGRYFIAIRRRDNAATGAPSSIGVHYTLVGDHRTLSLGFTRIGAAPKLAFTVFLAAPQTTGPSAPFSALTLDELDSAPLRRGDYAGAVEAAVKAHDSKAFVLENATQFSRVVTFGSGLARFADANVMLTRATTVVARENLSDDVIFGTRVTRYVPSQRTASLNAVRVRYASMGSLGLLLLAGALRRVAKSKRG